MKNFIHERHMLLVFFLAFVDVVMLFVAFAGGFWVRIESELIPYAARADLSSYLSLFFYSAPLLLIIFRSMRLYQLNELFFGTTEYVQIMKGCTFFMIALVCVTYALHYANPARGWLLCTYVLSILMVNTGRFVLRRIIRKLSVTHKSPPESAYRGRK